MKVTRKTLQLLTTFTSFCCALLLLPLHMVAQVNGALTIVPREKQIELKETLLISNVLKVKNNSGGTISFVIGSSMPKGWRMLNSDSTVYTIRERDSLFIPLRIMPKGPLKGNTEYLIDVVAYNGLGMRIASAAFSTIVIKKTDWDLNIEPSNKIYFLNDKKKTSFTVRYGNNGEDDEMVLTTFKQMDKKIRISDSSGAEIENYKNIFNLRARQDTQITFHVNMVDGKRNQRRVDLDNHRPNSDEEEKRYLLFLQSTEANRKQEAFAYRKSEKIELIKLSNRKKVNPYASDYLPLAIENNMFNILGNQPIMFVNLRGNTVLPNSASVFYSAQTNYSTYFSSPEFFRSVSYYVGYFDKKWDVQIGDMSGSYTVGYQSFGRGIKGSYNIKDKHNVGGFALKSPNLSTPNGRVSYGMHYRYTFNRSDYVSLQASRTDNPIRKYSTNFINAATHISFLRSQSITITAGTSIRTANLPNLKRRGTSFTFNYSGSYMKNKLINVSRISNLSRSFGENGSGRFYVFHQSDFYASRKTLLIWQSNYNTVKMPGLDGFKFFNNQVFVNLKRGKGIMIPSLFYNTQNNFGLRRHFRGLGFDYNYYEPFRNVKVSTSVRMGYNKLIDYPDLRNFFATQVSLLAQFRNISFTARYFYGPTVLRSAAELDNLRKYPQTFFTSIYHQYIFPNEYFVLQNNINYSHYNQFYSNTFGYFPELYFFTNNGWRFKAGVGLSVNVSNPRKALELQNPNLISPGAPNSAVTSTNLNVQFGLRKEFGIPIPKQLSKKRFVTIQYTCYMDVNGNRKRDKSEPELENVIVRTGDFEVMTDINGHAELANCPAGRYLMQVINLGNDYSWFPVLKDSMSLDKSQNIDIPFVKGSKISGQIYLQRERYASDADDVLDLSRIVITATDSAGNVFRTITRYDGTFELYVPNTRYTMNIDTKVWGDQFNILRNNFMVEMNPNSENTFISFQVVERQRKLQIRKF